MTDRGSPPPLRLFFAIELADEARRSAQAVVRALRKGPDGDALRWVRPEAYHVTVRFLGNVAAERVPELASGVRAELQMLAPFEIALGAVCAIPERGRLRVAALELAPPAPLARLADAVDRAVVKAGFPANRRPFRPHLTLGRARRGRRPGALRDTPAAKPAPFIVRDVVLFRSQLGPSGATYSSLERVALGVESHPSTRPCERLG